MPFGRQRAPAGPWINSYAASQGTSTYNIAGSNDVSGMFGNQRCYGVRDAVDGSSNTIAFSEFLVNPPQNFGRGRATGNVSGTQLHGMFDIQEFNINPATIQAAYQSDMQICATQFTATPGNGPGSRWSTGAMGYTIFNTVVPPNFSNNQYKFSACRAGCCAQAQHAHYVNASSNHSGGVNVLFTDGSVHFIKGSIALKTWWSLGTKAGGESISADQY